MNRPSRAGALLALAIPALVSGAAGDAAPTPVTADQLRAALRPSGGRPLLVHVWASWCTPCVAEWPDLAEFLREAAGRPVDVITLALDEPAGAAAAAKVLASAGPVPGRALRASPDLAAPALKAADPGWDGAVPTTLILGPEGKVVLAQRGVTRVRQLEQELDRLAPKKRRSP